jgi:hypothetical protein
MGVYESTYRRTHQLAVGYAMISVLLTIVGMVACPPASSLHSCGLLEMLRQDKH